MTDMFFFKEISGLVTAGVELNITIKRCGEKLIVSILPRVTDLKDDAAKRLIPLVISGTPDDLDKGFSAAISSPIQAASALLGNMKDFESSVAKTHSKSKSAEVNKKKFEQLSKKADELEKMGKLQNAISCLRQALDFTADKQTVQKRIDKLQAKAGTNSLFGEEEAIQENYLDEQVAETTNEEEEEE